MDFSENTKMMGQESPSQEKASLELRGELVQAERVRKENFRQRG